MRQARIGGAHRLHQRIDHLALDAVGEMARIRDVLEPAPAVGNFLVLGERVGDQRAQHRIGPRVNGGTGGSDRHEKRLRRAGSRRGVMAFDMQVAQLSYYNNDVTLIAGDC
jgi:hypothetical protein